jgi:hypothetical protein
MVTARSNPRPFTTVDYAPVHDHARLPWRFLARETGDSRL